MNISDSEMKLMELIWDNEPLKSGKLASLAFEKLNWKKSTVYTVVKKLTQKNIIKSENAVITSLYSRNEVLAEKSEGFLSKCCDGSLSMFLTAFLKKEKLSKNEAQELKQLIDNFTEDE